MDRNEERIDLLNSMHKEAASKLDYFILGATLAICAYLAQTNPYGKIAINKETFLLVSLLIFSASAMCGFKRLEALIVHLQLNVIALNEGNPAYRQWLLLNLKDRREPSVYYRARNCLLVLGLIVYLATKVWAAYQSNGWTSVH
jgi:hypothetical protein